MADLHERNRESLQRRWRRGYRKDLDLETAWQRIDALEAELVKLKAQRPPTMYLIPLAAKEGE